MVDESLALLTAHPEWAPVLDAYRVREQELAQQRASAAPPPASASKVPALPVPTEQSDAATAIAGGEAPGNEAAGQEAAANDAPSDDEESLVGWVERVPEIAGIERGALSAIHGRLIAFGLLKCEVGHRSAGLVYRLSAPGKSALKAFQAAQAAPLVESA